MTVHIYLAKKSGVSPCPPVPLRNARPTSAQPNLRHQHTPRGVCRPMGDCHAVATTFWPGPALPSMSALLRGSRHSKVIAHCHPMAAPVTMPRQCSHPYLQTPATGTHLPCLAPPAHSNDPPPQAYNLPVPACLACSPLHPASPTSVVVVRALMPPPEPRPLQAHTTVHPAIPFPRPLPNPMPC